MIKYLIMGLFENNINLGQVIAIFFTSSFGIFFKKIFAFIKYLKWKFFPCNFNLAISIDFSEKLNSEIYLSEILKNIRLNIDKFNLRNTIKVQDFSNTYRFKNKEEAEKFIIKKNLDLIVWGKFTTDGLKQNGKNINELKPLNFTYRYPQDKNNNIGKMLSFEISSKLSQDNYWKIIEDNSYTDVQIISNNLYSFSMYIIAVTLMLFGNIEKSKTIWESLYGELINNKDPLENQVGKHLLNCYEILVTNLLINQKDYEKGLTYCEKILKINNTNFIGLSDIALCQFKLGHIDDARKSIENLQINYRNNPLIEVDIAFFRIIEKNYKSAYKHYENLIKFKLKELNFLPQDIIIFLSEYYYSTKEAALLYGSGIVSYYFGDKLLAKEDLTQFIKQAKSDVYWRMRRRANKILVKFSKLL